MSLKFKRSYFIYFIVLLIIEAAIAVFVPHGFIRSHLGDFLVVILMYCFVKSITNLRPLYAASGVLIFAYVIEFLQYLKLIQSLYPQNNMVLKTVLGSTFEIFDLVYYTLGAITVLILEYKIWRWLLKAFHSTPST